MKHRVQIDVFVDEPDTDDPGDTFLRVQRALDDAGYGDTVCTEAVVVEESTPITPQEIRELRSRFITGE